jgi:hypothetical protein
MDPKTEDRAKPTSNRVTRKEEIRPLDHGVRCRMVKIEAGTVGPSAVVPMVIFLRRARRELPLLLQVLKIIHRLSEENGGVGQWTPHRDQITDLPPPPLCRKHPVEQSALRRRRRRFAIGADTAVEPGKEPSGLGANDSREID